MKVILGLVLLLNGHPIREPQMKEVASLEECTQAVTDILSKVIADPKPGLVVQASCLLMPEDGVKS